jgi:hypothetical protein
MPLCEAGENVLGSLDPGLRNPGEVRHDAGPLVRLAGLRMEPARRELAVDLGDGR